MLFAKLRPSGIILEEYQHTRQKSHAANIKAVKICLEVEIFFPLPGLKFLRSGDVPSAAFFRAFVARGNQSGSFIRLIQLSAR